jgi:membrane-bound lytic murein transglycosylase B
LRALTKPRPDLPPWRIVVPRPADELLGYYREAQAATGIDWTYLAAINLVETRMGRIRGLSTAGAQGPMQFLPSTWAQPGIGKGDIDDPHDAIQAAARFLVRHGGPRDMARALRAYNNSRHYVSAVTAYANEMARNPERYRLYHQWGVVYRWTRGEVMLLEGYTPPR